MGQKKKSVRYICWYKMASGRGNADQKLAHVDEYLPYVFANEEEYMLSRMRNSILLPGGRKDAKVEDKSISWREVIDADQKWLVETCRAYGMPGNRPRYELIYMLALNGKLSDAGYEWVMSFIESVKIIDSGETFTSDSVKLTKRSGLIDLVSKFPLRKADQIATLKSDKFEVEFYPHFHLLDGVISGTVWGSAKGPIPTGNKLLREEVAGALRERGHGDVLSVSMLQDAYQLINSDYFNGALNDWLVASWHTISFSVGSGHIMHGKMAKRGSAYEIRVSMDTMISSRDKDPIVSMLMTLEHELAHMIVNLWSDVTDKVAESHGIEFKRVMQYFFEQEGSATYSVPSGVFHGESAKATLQVGDRVRITWPKSDKYSAYPTVGEVTKLNPKTAGVKISVGMAPIGTKWRISYSYLEKIDE
jgi:hypothetical protein